MLGKPQRASRSIRGILKSGNDSHSRTYLGSYSTTAGGHEGTGLSWADTTEEQIALYVEQQVDERIQKYQQAENEPNKRLIALLGLMPYGMADTWLPDTSTSNPLIV